MIRDIRPLQSTDQNRLRDDHQRQPDGKAFARHLAAANEENSDESPRLKNRPSLTAPRLSGGNVMWSQFFADLNSRNANDSDAPLFHWGEQRENAKLHTQTAQRSALLNGGTPFHILNEKI